MGVAEFVIRLFKEAVKEPVRRYSQAFRQQIVLGYRAELVVIQSVGDQLEVKAMKERIVELESALAGSVLENRMLNTTLEVASWTLDVDIKKLRQGIIEQAAADSQVSKQAAIGWFGISRQAHYQNRKRQMVQAAEDQLLVELVQGIRQRHPRMGGHKLYHERQGPMAVLDISRGRDAFFDLLRDRDLLVPAKRSRRRTTRVGLWRCPNLLAGLELDQVHQAWVGDITYITTEQGFLYLALLTDAYSRFIVGYDLSSSLANVANHSAFACQNSAIAS